MIKPPSKSKTAQFYDQLMTGHKKRGILGKDKRYNPSQISKDSSTQKYFVEQIKPYVKSSDHVLDFGCGPGSFLLAAAPLCGSITGVDISREFVQICQKMINENGIVNANARHLDSEKLPFKDNSFDVVLMMDVIHHLENIDQALKEASRVLKPNGRFLIFEPNKLNPLIWMVHAFDRNEWGLLKLGTPNVYKNILSSYMNIDDISFNGIVIGPQSKLWRNIADGLNFKNFKPIFGWLNPKIFITGRKFK